MAAEEEVLLMMLDIQQRGEESLNEVRDKLEELAVEAKVAADQVGLASGKIDDSLASTAVAAQSADRGVSDSSEHLAGHYIDAMGRAHDASGRFVKLSEEDRARLEQGLEESAQKVETWRTKVGSAFDDLRGAMGRFGFLIPGLKSAEDDAGKSTDKLGEKAKQAGKDMKDASGQTADWVRTVRTIGLAVGGLAGPLSGIAALGVPAVFGGIAVAAGKMTASINQARASGQQLTTTQQMMLPVVTTLDGAFKSLDPVIQATLGNLGKTIQGLGPVFKQAASALGPMISTLGKGFGSLLTNLLPPLAGMMKSLQPVVGALAQGLGILGKGLAGLFTNLNLSAAAGGLKVLFSSVAQILPVIGKLLSAFAPLSNVILSGLLPPVVKLATAIGNALVPILQKLTPVIGPVMGIVSALGQYFGQLVSALAPLLGIAAQIAGVLAGFLSTALQQLVTALQPVMSALSQLAGAVMNALLSVLKALMPGLLAIVGAFVSLLPAVTPIIQPLIAVVKALTPILTVVAQLASKLLSALAPALSQIITAALQLLPPLLQVLPLFTQILTAIMPLITFVVQLATQLLGPLTTALTTVIGWLSQLVKLIAEALTAAIKFVIPVIQGLVRNLIKIFQGIVDFVTGIFTGNWSKAWDGVKKIFEGWVGYLWTPVKAVLKLFGGIPASIGKFFSNAGSWLYNAGANIIKGLISGITSMISGAGNAIGSVVNEIKSFLPWSPAKKGPLSGSGSPTIGGRNIIKQLADGIAASAPEIQAAMSIVAGHVAKPMTSGALGVGAVGSLGGSGLSTGGFGAGAAGSGTTIVLNVTGNTILNDRDVDHLAHVIGQRITTFLAPAGGVRFNY